MKGVLGVLGLRQVLVPAVFAMVAVGSQVSPDVLYFPLNLAVFLTNGIWRSPCFSEK